MSDINGQRHQPDILFAALRASHSDISSAPIATRTDTSTSRIAEVSPPGTCRNAYIADGTVRVSPGMFETNVIVAPNSPIALAKPRMLPAMIAGRINGKVTVANTQMRDAPSVDAACSSFGSTASIDRRI